VSIATGDIVYRVTGGASNTDPNASLGGAPSTAGGGVITSAVANNVWDDVSSAETLAGDTEYRCIVVKNNHGTLTWKSVVLWVDSLTSSADSEFDIGLEGGAVNTTPQTIANESTSPTGVSFTRPTSKGTALSIGDIPAGQFKAFWIRRTITAGAGAASDTGSIRCRS